MNDLTLSVVLPTIGRNTLIRALESFIGQEFIPGDELIIASDDNHAYVSDLVNEMKNDKLPLRYMGIMDGPHKDYGHSVRNKVMKLCKGDYIVHCDDDDCASKDMIASIRSNLTKTPTVFMFRLIDFRSKRKIWTTKGKLQRKYISTQNITHPCIPSTFGIWGKTYGSDSDFIIQTCAKVGKVIWVDKVTCIYGPPPELSLKEVYDWYDSL